MKCLTTTLAKKFQLITLKKDAVDPPYRAPYFIFVCLAKSSALSIGESIRSTVKNAAKFAVYDDIIISVKNHHIPATIRVETALGKFRLFGVVFDRAKKRFSLLGQKVTSLLH